MKKSSFLKAILFFSRSRRRFLFKHGNRNFDTSRSMQMAHRFSSYLVFFFSLSARARIRPQALSGVVSVAAERRILVVVVVVVVLFMIARLTIESMKSTWLSPPINVLVVFRKATPRLIIC